MKPTINHQRRGVMLGGAALLASAGLPSLARAADPIKVGLILPMSGPFTSTGLEVAAGVKLYQQRNGDSVAGRKVEVLIKDDGGVNAEITKRLAQELVTRDKVAVLAGFGLTPLALAAAPIATQAKTPMIIMAAGTSIVVQRSPYIVRTAFTLPQAAAPMAGWAAKTKIKTVVTFAADFGPGIDAEKAFSKAFTAAGGTIMANLRVPVRNPDYGPFLQKVKDLKPEAVFVFVPSGEGASLIKQFNDRGLGSSGIRLICTGDVMDDELLPSMGQAGVGVISSHHYSAAHPSPENKAYVEAFSKANPGMRPNFMSVGGYDGMHLLYEAIKKTNGDADGDKLLAAMKGMSWTSVRGPVTIDAETRDIVQNIYIREAKMVNGQLYNIEFDTFEQFRDPGV
jgi:branched-chain amino acid transport system substrate-binding protein